MKQILIIEDDINIAELEKEYLQLNGYKVEIIQNGNEGLKEALIGIYDLIIVDLMLPGKDGYEIVKEVRDKYEIPIIIVSARSEDIDKIKGLGFGADDYLTKPFSPSELVARIKSHILRYERLSGRKTQVSIISHKSLEIRTDSHKVFVMVKKLFLPQKSMNL